MTIKEQERAKRELTQMKQMRSKTSILIIVPPRILHISYCVILYPYYTRITVSAKIRLQVGCVIVWSRSSASHKKRTEKN
jgi:hypothetical protein